MSVVSEGNTATIPHHQVEFVRENNLFFAADPDAKFLTVAFVSRGARTTGVGFGCARTTPTTFNVF